MEVIGIVAALSITYLVGYVAVVLRGYHFATTGKPERALKLLNRVARYSPLFPWQVRGELLTNYFHDYEVAIKDFDRAIRSRRRDAKLYSFRGYAHYRLGHIDKALRDLEIAIALDPKLL